MAYELVRPPVEETCAHYIPESMRGKESFWDLPAPTGDLDKDAPEVPYFPHLRLPSATEVLIFGSSMAATALAVGAFATAKVDEVLGTHIGPSLERVKPDSNDDDTEKWVKEQLHKIGERAVREEAK